MSQTPQRRFVSFGLILCFWIAADLISKQYIFKLLPAAGDSITFIDGYVRLTHVKNRGAVWGILENMNDLLYVFHLLIAPFLFLFFLRALYGSGFLVGRITAGFVIASGLIMGGAVGNLYDRVSMGYVRDFIDVTIPVIDYRWPVFNIADSGITIGAVLLAFCILRYPPDDQTEREDEKDGGNA